MFVDCIYLDHNRIHWQALGNMVMDLWALYKERNILSSWMSDSQGLCYTELEKTEILCYLVLCVPLQHFRKVRLQFIRMCWQQRHFAVSCISILLHSLITTVLETTNFVPALLSRSINNTLHNIIFIVKSMLC